MENTPLKTLTDAARNAAENLKLKYRPVVVRDEVTAQCIAERTRGNVVMLGEDAFWVVCLADAERLNRAGYEYAPRR